MNISWYGHSCFKIQTKPKRGENDVIIITDPFGRSIGLRPPRGQADIVTISHIQHDDHNDFSTIKNDPFIIDAAGEYSVKGVSVQGIESFHDAVRGAERGRNTIFVIESENIRVCHLGDLGHTLTEKLLEQIGQIDIMMIPVGGTFTIEPKEAKEVIGQLEPKIVIPMHYKVKGIKIDFADENAFCEELGSCPKEKTSKLSVKRKDLDGIESEIIIMSIINS
ncbi:MAG: MBL fold metallo-hydrolase [Patescibacteria group bacterium]|nr:MBL fold metallo-hydrolase [Patescibacteria group bacterium]